MGLPRPIGGTLITVLVLATACAISESTAAPSRTAPSDGRCVTSYDPGKDYFPVKQTLRHATNFTLTYAKNYQIVTVEQPSPQAKPETYVLVRCGTPAPGPAVAPAGAIVVETPIRTLFSASTTHLPFLTELGVLDRLTGVASAGYISSAQVLARVGAGAVTEYAAGREIDTEKVVAARPDVLMTGGIEDKVYGSLRQAGIKVVANAEWLESTALGRAEWIKLVAALTGTEARAGEVFGRVEADYAALAAKAKGAAPVNVLLGQMYQGQWSMPGGGSYVSALVKDAGGTHAWAGTPGAGSTTLDLEAVLSKARGAKVWLATADEWRTLADVRKADSRYARFAAFTAGEVWSANKVIGPGGGNDFYERGVARPDLILGDLVAILHPEIAPGHAFTFYRKLAK
ncbi:ABC transporter substrate-binding protein [Sphaerisporangium siamense]|uniref:Iron complex transport system substrate-binding protein n=1 Tax=Sphaerisporangium siamense TaxID=795645 RepID=A0A7W7G6B2_9ACTN|nr:ABC transporter substrate-binding protein [Sphaerisporangium siamense]MBB4699353.1 iron complex transport system substrate-binding protein [Sphaerisporangium siamense]GII89264.1 ABC transporter substrate-binding protein [Sphaerisporangium siamense]